MRLPPIPEPLRLLLERLPQYPPSAVCAAVLTLWLGETLGSDAHPELDGKLIRVHIIDVGVTLTFRVTPRGFAPSGAANPALPLAAAGGGFLARGLRFPPAAPRARRCFAFAASPPARSLAPPARSAAGLGVCRT